MCSQFSRVFTKELQILFAENVPLTCRKVAVVWWKIAIGRKNFYQRQASFLILPFVQFDCRFSATLRQFYLANLSQKIFLQSETATRAKYEPFKYICNQTDYRIILLLVQKNNSDIKLVVAKIISDPKKLAMLY